MEINCRKIFNIITPLTLLGVLALFITIDGLSESQSGGHENYAAILFIIDLPITIISILLHFGIRWYFQKKVLYIWLSESVLMGYYNAAYLFQKVIY